MKLTVRERLMLLGVLPREGSFATLRIIRRLQDELSFTEEEHQEFGLRETEEGIVWNTSAEREKEIKIGFKASEVIVTALKELDRKNQLRVDHISLFEKFVLDEEGE